MFEIATNKEGVACIVTNMPALAFTLRRETSACGVPIWFTGAPNLKAARKVVKLMEAEFGRKVSLSREGSSGFYAFFILNEPHRVETKRGPYTYSPDGADPRKSPWPFKVEPADAF